MNREILFRGKRVDNGEWVYGYYLVKAEKHIIWSRGDIQSYQVTPKTIGQFTGLTDKNGNKIFEGDVLEDGSIIIWRDDLASFAIRKEKWLHDHYFGEAVDAGYTEITGNIHDNDKI